MLTEHKHIVEDVAYVLFLYIVDNVLISYSRPKGTDMGDGDGGAGTIFFCALCTNMLYNICILKISVSYCKMRYIML